MDYRGKPVLGGEERLGLGYSLLEGKGSACVEGQAEGLAHGASS